MGVDYDFLKNRSHFLFKDVDFRTIERSVMADLKTIPLENRLFINHLNEPEVIVRSYTQFDQGGTKYYISFSIIFDRENESTFDFKHKEFRLFSNFNSAHFEIRAPVGDINYTIFSILFDRILSKFLNNHSFDITKEILPVIKGMPGDFDYFRDSFLDVAFETFSNASKYVHHFKSDNIFKETYDELIKNYDDLIVVDSEEKNNEE